MRSTEVSTVRGTPRLRYVVISCHSNGSFDTFLYTARLGIRFTVWFDLILYHMR